MLGDTFEVLVLLGTAVVLALVGHSRSERYIRTSLVVAALSTVVWFVVVVASHHSPALLIQSILTARVTAGLFIILATVAAVCALIIAQSVSFFFGVGGRIGIMIGLALLAFFFIIFLKACVVSNSGAPVDPL